MTRTRILAATLAALAVLVPEAAAIGQEPPKPKPASTPPATPAERIKVGPKGFKVELIYTVPRDSQGSWVNLAVDPKGRLYASDQYGKIYRVTPSKVGAPASEIRVEPVPAAIGQAQGLLWAFDSLYVVVNAVRRDESGLYRVSDTDGDDTLDRAERLLKIDGNSEHGPHAVVLAPDGKSLYVVAGNSTRLPDLTGSLVPRVWGEDNLLPRMTDGRGFMPDEKAPSGFVVRVSPDGKTADLISMGYRNTYDIAFNRAGDLFAYDSDMEWDLNTPWYRPTRVLMVASGSDFGCRNGAGKWPSYYLDSLPAALNVGLSSPTGIAFGYGAKFPAKYQDALFLCDWTYGKLYAAHLKPDGSSYSGELEEFLSGTPLPLTDVVINPVDGAMYFAIGGRKTTSGLYRVTYAGPESTAPTTAPIPGEEARATRRMLEAFHGHADPKAVEAAWPYLAYPDRSLRYAARVAIEFQDAANWRDKALSETNPTAAIEALLALTQVSAADPAHRTKGEPEPDKGLETKILGALERLDWGALPYARKLDAARVYEVVLNRFGMPDEATAKALTARLDAGYPSNGRELNVELCNLLVYLKSPTVASKTMPLIEKAATQEEQIDYARALRTLAVGWTPELRRAYFSWIDRASGFRGGMSIAGFMKQIRDAAVATLTDAEKAELRPILDAPARSTATAAHPSAPTRAFVKAWTMDDLVPVVESGLKKKRDFERGRSLFAAANCFACHRFGDEGGAIGPDLTGVAGRFSPRDLVESIVLPSKVISDQYEAVIVATDDGRVITGRITNFVGDTMTISTDMLDPNAQVTVDRTKIEETRPSPTSMMPEGLLSTLDRDEVVDLVAYLLSRGDRESPLFR